jgi:hypothetical protein
VAINIVLKFSIAGFIGGMKLRNKSEEAIYAMLAVTLTQFFNTGVLLFVRNYSASNNENSINADNNSLSVFWYSTSGVTLVSAMKITAYWPLIEIAAFGSVFKILRYLDRGCTSDKLKTKLPSIQTYIDLHAGPEFAIHWRYSAVLFQLSIALFFGTGMPIIYVIAFVGCIIQYIVDRLLICYFYREPPAYDDRITIAAVNSLKYIATFSLLGAWY